jgi:hypothetical protein
MDALNTSGALNVSDAFNAVDTLDYLDHFGLIMLLWLLLVTFGYFWLL